MSNNNLNILNETQSKKEREENNMDVENVSRLMEKKDDDLKNNESVNMHRN